MFEGVWLARDNKVPTRRREIATRDGFESHANCDKTGEVFLVISPVLELAKNRVIYQLADFLLWAQEAPDSSSGYPTRRIVRVFHLQTSKDIADAGAESFLTCYSFS